MKTHQFIFFCVVVLAFWWALAQINKKVEAIKVVQPVSWHCTGTLDFEAGASTAQNIVDLNCTAVYRFSRLVQ